MDNLIVIGILLLVVGAAVLYIWKEKKKGTRCIGCPAAGCCCAKECGNIAESCQCHNGSKCYIGRSAVPGICGYPESGECCCRTM